MGSNDSAPVREYSAEMIAERQRLLNTRIHKISLIMQPSNKFMEGYEVAAAGVSMFLPACMTCANRNHAGMFVFGENDSYDGVYIEFGPYNYRNEKDFDNKYVHYFQGNDGLRFVSANYSEIRGIKYDCEVEYEMTIGVLLKGLAYHGWTKKDYDEEIYEPSLQMCIHKDSKDFIIKVIRTLGAKRIHKSDRIRSFAKAFIPCDLIDELENNEKCINFEERIPIVGPFAGIIKMIIVNNENQ